jgi:polyisoprenyl-phosphate glycosyltransferase
VSDHGSLLSIVAPIYDEAPVVAAFHERVRAAVQPLGPYELILVDDGSTDGSWERMLELAAADPAVRLIRLSRNFGHQQALTAGIDAARGDAVVTIDSDLQDPPELIPELVARWQAGYDVVYAVRSERAGERRWRLLGIGLYYRFLRRAAGTSIPAQAGDFRLLSRRAVDALARMPERARFLRGMSSWIGFRQVGVPYRRDARHAGKTKYPLRKLVRLALDGVLSFSTLPLKLVSLLGFVLVVFCMGVLAWSIYTRFFTNHHPQGWTSVIAVVLLLGGVQLLSLGVIGQYIARIFDEAKQRPLYLVDEVVEGGAALEQREPTSSAPAP